MTDIAHEVLAMPYTRVLRAADQGGFACEVLEFSGCFATGDTAEEAMVNLEEAMVMWAESEHEAGHDIPRPLVAGEYSGRMTLRIPPSLHERAALQAQIEGVSLNRLLSAAVASYIGEVPGQVPGGTMPIVGIRDPQSIAPGIFYGGGRLPGSPESGAWYLFGDPFDSQNADPLSWQDVQDRMEKIFASNQQNPS